MDFIADLMKDKTDSQRRFLELLIPLWLDVVAQISEDVDTSPDPETLLRELRVRMVNLHIVYNTPTGTEHVHILTKPTHVEDGDEDAKITSKSYSASYERPLPSMQTTA